MDTHKHIWPIEKRGCFYGESDICYTSSDTIVSRYKQHPGLSFLQQIYIIDQVWGQDDCILITFFYAIFSTGESWGI